MAYIAGRSLPSIIEACLPGTVCNGNRAEENTGKGNKPTFPESPGCHESQDRPEYTDREILQFPETVFGELAFRLLSRRKGPGKFPASLRADLRERAIVFAILKMIFN